MEYKTDLDKLRHSCSHVMAQAVQELWPDTKVTIGPAIEGGFYYDFDRKESFTPEDLEKIEKKMRQIIQKKPVFTQSFMPKKEAIKVFSKMKENSSGFSKPKNKFSQLIETCFSAAVG